MAEQSILEAFFEECEDLIAALTEGLSEMRDGHADSETINAVFRAVHSIKGAAGAFALEDLVEFAHKFETVLDEVRGGRLSLEDNLLRVLQKAGDVLAGLVDSARDKVPANNSIVSPVLDDLQSFLGIEEAPEEFVFEALSLSFDAPERLGTYRVTFQPMREFYGTGNDPQLVIAALQELGSLKVEVSTKELPDGLDDFQWDNGYLIWKVEIEGLQNDLPIRDIFQFIDDLCGLEIKEVLAEITAPDISTPNPGIALSDQEKISLKVTDPSPPQSNEKLPAKTEKASKKPASTLRVDPERVDRLINAVGELIINQSVISQRIEEAAPANSAELYGDLDDYRLLAREIQEGVMAIRAQPVKPLFQRMLRIAREAADATGKEVTLVTEGETTEVDKIVVERLADPLTHMIRNAIDHGIEAPNVREEKGKTRNGTLRLTASQRSGTIVIEIIDDGAGLNRPRIREIAVNKGLVSQDVQLSEQEIDHLLFAPGFSTAQEVTNLSGRGVGMDVVKTTITELGGRVAINSVPGEGTTFSITLPLTLAVMDGMIIDVGGQTMVVPIASIVETVRPTDANLSKIGLNNNLIRIRGEYVPIIDLATQLGAPPCEKALTERVLLLIQTEAVAQCALAVDDIFDQRQVVVKSMQGNYGEIEGISGATILGDGKIALIIDADAISSTARINPTPQIQSQRGNVHVTTR